MQNGSIRSWMTPEPITVTSQTTLPEAYRLMKARGVRRLPVLEDGELVGLVTVSDIRQAAPLGMINITAGNSTFAHTRVRRVMTQPVMTISPDATITQAARLLIEHKIGGLPVVEDGALIGILTESDLFRVLVAALEPAAA